jgi:hypothetical protein
MVVFVVGIVKCDQPSKTAAVYISCRELGNVILMQNIKNGCFILVCELSLFKNHCLM